MATPRLSANYTYGDYLQWTGDERWALHDGVPVLINAPSNGHQEILGLLVYFINDCIRSNQLAAKVYPGPFDVVLGDAKKPEKRWQTVIQPDISVFRDHSRLDPKGHGARRAPDWVIEIASPSTSSRDRGFKRQAYEHYGCNEYWIVYPDEETVVTHTRQGDKLKETGRYEGRVSLSPQVLPELVLDLGELWINDVR